MNRKPRIFAAAVALVLLHGASLTAEAQTYPSRPVKIIVPTPAGGPVDVMARLVANQLSPALGQSVFIDNRGGAAIRSAPPRPRAPRPTAIRCSIRAPRAS